MKLKALILAVVTACSAAAQEPVNDINTPLHLMQPDYGFFYGIPDRDSVKGDIDRVLSFLETAMPAATDGDRLRQGSFRMSSYEMGVLYSAAIDAARATGGDRYSHFATDRLTLMAALAPKLYDKLKADRNYDRQMRPVVLPGSLDEAGAMCAAYCYTAIRHPEADCPAVIKTYMNRVWKTYRSGDDRIIARNRPYANSVWLDDMYMGIVPMAWYGCYKGDTASVRDAVGQIRAFKRRMWLPGKRIFRHGWVETMKPHPAFAWGRANGWAILTMCQVLDAMKMNHENLAAKGKADYAGYAADSAFVLDLLRQHADGLMALQDKTGFWHQLLDVSDSYLETSATAIYAYCLAHAICEGWLDAKVYGPPALLAWNAVASRIDGKGHVEGVCVGTGMGFDKALYCYRPVHVMAAHGYGPVIWAGGEIIRLLGMFRPVMHDSAVLFGLGDR